MNFSSSAAAVVALGRFDALSDEALLDAQRVVAGHQQALDVVSASLAGEIDRRSARELGYDGLAQKAGFVSPAALIQSITGGSKADAAKHVAVGSALDSPVGVAVLNGTISVDAAAAIQRGLGATDHTATPLLQQAASLDADELYRRARDLREQLDASAVARREKQQRDLRYFRHHRRPDGMVAGSFLLDPVDGALVSAAVDAVLSPRRGGPRFVDRDQAAADAALAADERSTEQIAADALVAMVRLAVDADPGSLFGSRRPAVRVVVTADRAVLEDSGQRISMATAERFICDAGVIPVKFDDDGQCVNVGRTQRLFTERQRIGLAVRDGGCRFPGCDRPPSWCEAHHIDQWARDHGRTDLADGVLLCRRHHLLVHNNQWQVSRDAATYWLTSPDGEQNPMPTKSRVLESRVLEKRVLSKQAG
jgi:hypothetical protein